MTILWLCELSGLTDDIYVGLRNFLPKREQYGLDRLAGRESRAQKLVSRCMAYMAVEAYCGQPIEYADIWFPVDASPVYKPLRKPSNNVSLSLSHSKGGVVVAASLRGALGVDVLDHDRPRNWRSIALNYFPKVDVDYLQSLPEDKAIAAFRQLWCWKEALVKAAGLSLVEALHFPFMEPDGVPCKIMWGATSFYLRADVHAGYTVGLLTEEAFEYQVLATTPKKILASLVQAGQS